MLRLIRSGYGQFSARRLIGPARWPHHDLLFVHRGSVRLEFPELDQQVHVPRGAGVLIWPQTAFHGQAMGTKAAQASIQHFALTGSQPLLHHLESQREGFSSQGAPPSAWLESCVHRLQRVSSQPINDSQAELRTLLLQIVLIEGRFLDSTAPAPSSERISIVRLEHWLRSHLSANPALPEMARFCGLSTSRFRAVFHQQTGQTAGQFLRQVRDAEAKRLLAGTPEPIKVIAAALGYASPAVFHHAFKFRTGETPARFRRREAIRG